MDVTSRFDPHLLSVAAIDALGMDQCHIELDDRDGRLRIPIAGRFSRVSVLIGWHSESYFYSFDGWIWIVESGFSRGTGGRRLWIDAMGVPRDEGKSPMQKIWAKVRPAG
ncbi:hypothetical protein [Bradyrhizobium sp. RDI18]|uniref:hypothetical protein n=1 Tax=Bradyrhizobium sp. RDI18 TaxID=3367400 RepID=UPI0037217D05